mmetsp:Transcript_2243/g.6410  ORF Transcript_2243/g.6410 Transcript_2243/m.6410 type:complete len:174 (+) Transcript_2243:709-1230(+)
MGETLREGARIAHKGEPCDDGDDDGAMVVVDPDELHVLIWWHPRPSDDTSQAVGRLGLRDILERVRPSGGARDPLSQPFGHRSPLRSRPGRRELRGVHGKISRSDSADGHTDEVRLRAMSRNGDASRMAGDGRGVSDFMKPGLKNSALGASNCSCCSRKLPKSSLTRSTRSLA